MGNSAHRLTHHVNAQVVLVRVSRLGLGFERRPHYVSLKRLPGVPLFIIVASAGAMSNMSDRVSEVWKRPDSGRTNLSPSRPHPPSEAALPVPTAAFIE